MTRKMARAAGTLALAALVALAALMLVPAALGYERYVITSDSMSGTYDRGSLVIERAVPTAELRVGDVITYVPPPGSGPAGRVTHRIASIKAAPGGERSFRTKGDANASKDPWRFALAAPTQARAVFGVPYVGYAFAALGFRHLRMLVIGLPAALIAFALLARLWREAGEEVRRREADAAPEAS